ncbi:MAG: hypothetical protein F6J90_24750 [Moorea sp. SIOASIH]|uniref:hypothetical protein n=1 Tax=Moorena sp. SIOASIH TaxID=2607817 RepID=UPI0013BD28A9|nr:hypothetical protein [Moorena sp. SIOASIH]NEO39368.1 hypothetical protein [Moorena sp. SIOASIH]
MQKIFNTSKRSVVSGQWSVVSGQHSAVSGQWSVVSLFYSKAPQSGTGFQPVT